jgi:hypothetical protein
VRRMVRASLPAPSAQAGRACFVPLCDRYVGAADQVVDSSGCLLAAPAGPRGTGGRRTRHAIASGRFDGHRLLAGDAKDHWLCQTSSRGGCSMDTTMSMKAANYGAARSL